MVSAPQHDANVQNCLVPAVKRSNSAVRQANDLASSQPEREEVWKASWISGQEIANDFGSWTRKRCSPEEKIGIFLEGQRGKGRNSDLCLPNVFLWMSIRIFQRTSWTVAMNAIGSN